LIHFYKRSVTILLSIDDWLKFWLVGWIEKESLRVVTS